MYRRVLTLIWIALGAAAPLAQAAGPIGQITHLSGVLAVERSDGSSKVLALKSDVHEGDLLTTQKDTYARIKFVDGAEAVLRPDSQLKIANYAYAADKPGNDSVVLSMLKGGLRAVTGLIGKRSRESVSIRTPTATIGIRGTHFGALFCQNDCGNIATATGKPPENGLHLDVVDGAIVVKNAGGEQVISTGQFGYVGGNNTPPVVVPPQQGIQVTMPPKISQNDAAGRSIGVSNDGECIAQ